MRFRVTLHREEATSGSYMVFVDCNRAHGWVWSVHSKLSVRTAVLVGDGHARSRAQAIAKAEACMERDRRKK